MYEFDPTNLANEICGLIKAKKPDKTEHITLDVTIDVGMAHRAYYELYFLDGRMGELDYYGRSIMDESRTYFQKALGELDQSQVSRLLNAISYRLTLTPTKTAPRKACIHAHWTIS